jgi:hypothetical protein
VIVQRGEEILGLVPATDEQKAKAGPAALGAAG